MSVKQGTQIRFTLLFMCLNLECESESRSLHICISENFFVLSLSLSLFEFLLSLLFLEKQFFNDLREEKLLQTQFMSKN